MIFTYQAPQRVRDVKFSPLETLNIVWHHLGTLLDGPGPGIHLVDFYSQRRLMYYT